jgi:hypothetical protein
MRLLLLPSKILKFVFGREALPPGHVVGALPSTFPTGGGARPPLLLFDCHLLLENEWNALKIYIFVKE